MLMLTIDDDEDDDDDDDVSVNCNNPYHFTLAFTLQSFFTQSFYVFAMFCDEFEKINKSVLGWNESLLLYSQE